MSATAIKIENLKKQYKLGTIGGVTLNAEFQSWWARKRGKEDPNLKIGQGYHNANETFWALNGINLEVKKGEALGIIGANGAGKSTLLKILSRVTAPTEGDIWIDRRISSMLEVGTGFHNELTGRENIYMNGAILGMSKKEVDRKIKDIIEFSECEQFPISGKKGMSYEAVFAFELLNLAEGIYYVFLNMFIADAIGGMHEIDATEKIYFEVIETNKNRVLWQRRYCGSVRLNMLQIVSNEVKA